MSITMNDVEIPAVDEDVTPDKSIYCQECGVNITGAYSGRGRKPKFCDEHKRTTRSTPAARKTSTASVSQAVSTLETIYSAIGTGLMLFGAPQAAMQLAEKIPNLSAQNRMYLEQDPKLVKMITRGSAAMGRAGFITAQIVTLAPVVVLAMGEMRAPVQDAADEMSHGLL